VAQHQSQCSIFANQQLKVHVRISFASVRAVFGRSLRGFRSVAECWPTLINPFTDCFHWAKLSTFSRKFCNHYSVSKTKFPQCLDPSFISVRYFIHNQSYRPNCDYDLKYWRIYYFLVCLVYFILLLFIVSRSDISAGNSLSVPQYWVVPFFYTDVWFIFVIIMLFTEINAAVAACCT